MSNMQEVLKALCEWKTVVLDGKEYTHSGKLRLHTIDKTIDNTISVYETELTKDLINRTDWEIKS